MSNNLENCRALPQRGQHFRPQPQGVCGGRGSGCSPHPPAPVLVLIRLLDADVVIDGVIGARCCLAEAFALPFPDARASLQILCPFLSGFVFIIES